MALEAIPCAIMAAISLYVGAYHLAIYLKLRQTRGHLAFALMCLGVGLYDIFCVGLYSSHSVAQGVIWDRLQLHDINFVAICFIWFAYEFTGKSWRRPLLFLAGWFVLLLIGTSLLPARFMVNPALPSIETVDLFGRFQIVYYEGTMGLAADIELISTMLFYLYVLVLFVRFYLRTRSRAAAAIVFGQIVFCCAVINDALVATRVYSSIYLSEYAYLVVILSMAYVLLNDFVAVYREVENDKATLEARVAERTAELGRLAVLVASSHDAIFGVDLDGRITSWNPGAEQTFGYTSAEMVGQTELLLVPDEFRAEAWELSDGVRSGRAIESYETIRRRKDGRRIDVALTLSPIRDERGVMTGMAETARDVSERKALLAGIIRAERLESLETLARGISHQFNNANAIVKNYLEHLKRADNLPQGAIGYLNGALAGVERILSITERLEGLASVSPRASGKLRVEELIRGFLPDFSSRVAELAAEVTPELNATQPVEVDHAQLGFTFAGLMNNALDSLVDRSVRRIHIRTGTDDQGVYFEIADSGCGIPSEETTKIFSPFFTTKGEWARAGSPQSKVPGVGLTLAVCHTTLAERGGRIEFESEVDVGSTFRVWLPRRHRPIT